MQRIGQVAYELDLQDNRGIPPVSVSSCVPPQEGSQHTTVCSNFSLALADDVGFQVQPENMSDLKQVAAGD